MSYNAGPLDPIASLREALRGHYEIGREIGQGAFATVYLARDLKHERKVAVKVLNADPNSETGELRFIREIRMLARLQHPNILPLHDSGHVDALLYYVMPFVSGETLRERIDRERQLPIEDAVCIAQEAADALACAHGQGIIHRDIKPENILLSGGHAIVADFGIARAIDIAGIRQLTRTGVGIPGTPAYMAPEQLLGDREVDAKADIYSVGCVLYEMLTGKPPFAGKEGFVKRFTAAPPAASSLRQDVPAWVDEILSMTLARDPAERYANASLLARALTLELARERWTPIGAKALVVEAPHKGVGLVETPAVDIQTRDRRATPLWLATERWLRSRRGVLALSAAAGLLVFAAVTFAVPDLVKRALGLGPAPDSTRYAILPLAADDSASEGIAAHASDKLYDAFRSWNGLSLVPDLKVDEAIKNGGSPRTLSEALSLARQLNAGQLVWGHVVRVGDSLRPRAELYDLRHPSSTVKEVLVLEDKPESYLATATALLAPSDRPAIAAGADRQTRDYPAWNAYNQGHIALARWDLATAKAQFAHAVRRDPGFPSARLWLAQIEEWQAPLTPDLWRENAERAVAGSGAMTEGDRQLSLGLAAMANKRYPEACAAYQRFTQLDSLSFIGWYLLGECQGLDRVVLRDPGSASGWRWRSSYESAVKSFVRALRSDPGTYTLLSFPRLRRLLPTTAVSPRTDDPVAPNFAAVPSLTDADTLAFVPYPISVFRSGLPPNATSTLNRALSRNLDVLVGIVNTWVQRAPNSPDAYESLADMLETRGDIADGTNASLSASAAVRKAHALSRDPQQLLRLAVREARLRFKRGDYVGARMLADSILRHSSRTDLNDPPVLISLTALTGRVDATAEQAASVVVPQKLDGITLSSGLRTVAGTLFANAALGVCGDSLTVLQSRLEGQVRSTIAEEQRERVRAALLARPLSMMVPCTAGASALGIAPMSGNLAVLQRAFARNDRREVQRSFETIARVRRAYRPGEVSFDRTFQEAWIRTAIGDTVGAIRQLDESLNAIPSMSAAALREAAAASAAGRAMALRAELGLARGDTLLARRWASAVAQLWQDADHSLQPVVARMRTIAAAGH